MWKSIYISRTGPITLCFGYLITEDTLAVQVRIKDSTFISHSVGKKKYHIYAWEYRFSTPDFMELLKPGRESGLVFTLKYWRLRDWGIWFLIREKERRNEEEGVEGERREERDVEAFVEGSGEGGTETRRERNSLNSSESFTNMSVSWIRKLVCKF